MECTIDWLGLGINPEPPVKRPLTHTLMTKTHKQQIAYPPQYGCTHVAGRVARSRRLFKLVQQRTQPFRHPEFCKRIALLRSKADGYGHGRIRWAAARVRASTAVLVGHCLHFSPFRNRRLSALAFFRRLFEPACRFELGFRPDQTQGQSCSQYAHRSCQ